MKSIAASSITVVAHPEAESASAMEVPTEPLLVVTIATLDAASTFLDSPLGHASGNELRFHGQGLVIGTVPYDWSDGRHDLG